MNEIKTNISIIVPVYNVEKYLVRCLNSIFSQSFSGTFEVITIDDASNDNSLSVLKNYKLKAPQLKIIKHQTNKKLSCARLSGIKVAKGDYIMHVDSDDYLLPDTLENLYKNCLVSGADVMVYNYIRENKNGERFIVNQIKEELITINKEVVHQFFLGACWNKIVKRSLTENMIFGNIGINMGGEDLLYSSEILLRANTIYLSPSYYYIYSFNPKSMSIINPVEYLRTQITVLNSFNLLVINSNPTSSFTNYTIDYLEKWLYFEIAKIHFYYMDSLEESKEIINQISFIPIITRSRILRLENALDNKFISLCEVNARLGFKLCLSILLRSYIKKIALIFKRKCVV